MFSYLNLPLIRSILAAQNGLLVKKETYQIDKKLADDVVRLLNIDYIVFHKIYKYYRSTLDLVRQMIPTERIFEDDTVVILKTNVDRKTGEFIDAGTVQSIPYLQKGWINGQKSVNVDYAWSTGGSSTILLNLSDDARYDMELRMTPNNHLEDRGVKIYLNDTLLASLELDSGWRTYVVGIPESAINKGTDYLRLEYSDSRQIDSNFGGRWVQGTVMKYITVGPNLGVILHENVFDWEQDNNKFRGSAVSIALDSIAIERK